MTRPAEDRPRRTRRSGQEIRTRMLTAACEMFAELGYAGTSTKEIARRAEVTEVLLFRHFGSKAGLFDEAVIEPFSRFVDSYAATWARRIARRTPSDQLGREYIDLFYGFVEENRQLFVALLGARAHHPTAGRRLDELFDRLQTIVTDSAAAYSISTTDPAMTVRLTFGLVLSAVIHSDVLFPSGTAVPRAELVDHMTRLILHGVIETSG